VVVAGRDLPVQAQHKAHQVDLVEAVVMAGQLVLEPNQVKIPEYRELYSSDFLENLIPVAVVVVVQVNQAALKDKDKADTE
jgi:hypothetical protein